MKESISNINKSLIEQFEQFNNLFKTQLYPLLENTKKAIDLEDTVLAEEVFYGINLILNDDEVLKDIFEVNTILHKEVDTTDDLNTLEYKLTKKIIEKYQYQPCKKNDKYNELYFEILGVYNSLTYYRFNKNFLPDIVQNILELKIKYNSDNIKKYININDLNLLYSSVEKNLSDENAAKLKLKMDIEVEGLKDKQNKEKLDGLKNKSKTLDEVNVEDKFKDLLKSLDEILQIDI
ncbi:hypothetical protein ACO0R3_001743 [Hanseniaspora guilliermondii]